MFLFRLLSLLLSRLLSCHFTNIALDNILDGLLVNEKKKHSPIISNKVKRRNCLKRGPKFRIVESSRFAEFHLFN